jgi:hypothetical protein
MKLTAVAFLLISCLLQAAGSAASDSAAAPDLDRSGFGNSSHPIWSRLTPFEILTLDDADLARAGDGDALLALYLVAAGDMRDETGYRHHRGVIDDWLRDAATAGDEQSLGRLLLTGMHRRFLGPELSAEAVPRNYNADQSRLSRVLESGEFNCISSAMLYIVIARKAGLDVQGVILPSHAFVQLTTAEGKTLDIETTSPAGFGQPHDEAFYATASDQFLADRELPAPTWEDYRNREIVDPFALALFNMSNQHTAEERMAYADRMRLAEVRSQLLPQDVGAQKSRLAYYYREFAHLNEAGDYATAIRLFDQVGGWLEDQLYQHPGDTELLALVTAVQARAAEALVARDREQEGLELAKLLLHTRDLRIQSFSVENQLFSIISQYAVTRAEAEDYPGAREAFSSVESQCLQNKLCNSGLAHVYSSWAMHYVESRDWQSTVHVYREYLQLDNSSALSGHFTSNLERAYLNWSARVEWEGDWQTALALLDRCATELDGAAACSDARRKLAERHRAGSL